MTDHYDQREDLYSADKARAAADAMRESLAGDVRRVLVQLRANVTMRERDIAKGTASLPLMARAGLISTSIRLAEEGDIVVYHLTQYGRLRLDADESRYGIPPLTGNLSDVLVKPHVHSVADQQHTHGVTDGGHSQTLHTGEHSHFAGVTDDGYHGCITGKDMYASYPHGPHGPGVATPVALGHAYPFGAPMTHDVPGLHHRSTELPYGIPGLTRAAPVEIELPPYEDESRDEWPRAKPLKTPLRARVFYDGSLVIDNPARPLVVRPMRPDDMNGHTEEVVSTEVDAEAFIRAAIMLAQAMGERL
jgi:hypothetical protein